MSWTQQATLGQALSCNIMLSLGGSTEVMEGSIIAVCFDGDVSVLKCQHQPSEQRNKMTDHWSCLNKFCIWNSGIEL